MERINVPRPVGAERHEGNPLIARRDVLRGLGLGSAALALAGCGSAVAQGLALSGPPASTLVYWNLFSGGDGANMETMEAGYERSHRGVSLDASVLSWGNPYYTKLALATEGGRPPDVAITHLSRMTTLAQAGLLTPMRHDDLAAVGISKSDFTSAAVAKATMGGELWALPLDTHPFVMYYNKTICKKAGLLDAQGKLKAIRGPEELTAALAAAKKVTGHYGGVVAINNDPSTNWRWFDSLYGQLGGTVIGDNGAKITLNDDHAAKALEFMRSLTVQKKLMPDNIDDPGVTALFSTGKAGFLFDGEWQLTTYAATPIKFGMVPLPIVYGDKLVNWADSHSFIIPRNNAMTPARHKLALQFIRYLLGESLTWAKGGHIPAWLPVQHSQAYLHLEPQADYRSAANAARYDPPAWYSGAGSEFENIVGAAIASSQSGASTAAQAVRAIRSGLKPYADAKPPIS